MRNFKKAAALVMTTVMLLSVAACGKTNIKEYDQDSFIAVLEDDLGLSEDDYVVMPLTDGEGEAVDGENMVMATMDDALVTAFFYKDAEDAKESFEEYYDDYQDDDEFEGEAKGEDNGDNGYLVMKTETDLGELYAGIYYSGSMFIMVISGEDTVDAQEQVQKIIDALGYPGL